MKKCDVSVVIPCYNSESTIQRAINSVTSQSLPPKELIIIDDGSIDHTLEIIYNFKKNYTGDISIIIIKLRTNHGVSFARNYGWDICNCMYVAFLDSDDSWHENKLEIQYAYMKYSDVDICATNTILFDKKDFSRETSQIKLLTLNDFLIKNRFSSPSVMIKKSLSFRFDTSIRYCEDYNLWMKIVSKGYKALIIEKNLTYIHKDFYGHSGLSADIVSMWKGELHSFSTLKKEKVISQFTYIIVCCFSFLKLIKRTINTSQIKLLKYLKH